MLIFLVNNFSFLYYILIYITSITLYMQLFRDNLLIKFANKKTDFANIENINQILPKLK